MLRNLSNSKLILGWTGYLAYIWKTQEEWKVRLLFLFMYTFQVSSNYFVAFIVFLRMCMVRNPTGFRVLHKRITKNTCLSIWILSVVFYLIVFIDNCMAPDQNVFKALILIRTNLGFALPVVLSISLNIYLISVLRRVKTPSNNLAKNEQDYRASHIKLINGLVVWTTVCNVPFIAYVHYQLYSGNWTKTAFQEFEVY